MKVILLGLGVYGTLFQFYLLLTFLLNNYTKLATCTSFIGRNGAVNTAQWCKCVLARYIAQIGVKSVVLL